MAHILAYENKNAEGRHILCTQCVDGFELMNIIKRINTEGTGEITFDEFFAVVAGQRV